MSPLLCVVAVVFLGTKAGLWKPGLKDFMKTLLSVVALGVSVVYDLVVGFMSPVFFLTSIGTFCFLLDENLDFNGVKVAVLFVF